MYVVLRGGAGFFQNDEAGKVLHRPEDLDIIFLIL